MSIEELKIKKELETIKKTKEKINKYIGMLIAKKIDEDKIEDKERKDNLFKIRSSCLSCMNIALYRYNITNFKRKIKNNGIIIPKDNFLNLLNYKHLLYYRSMLNKFYNEVLKIKSGWETSMESISTPIAEAYTGSGLDARTYFYDHENITPLEDLEKYFSEKYQKKVELVPKENHETVVYDVPNNTVLVKTSEVLIGITNSETKEELYKKIENLKKEIINNLSYIPGIKNDYAFYNSLYNQIVKKVYNRDVNEIINTLNNRKDIPIKISSLISVMPIKHLTYFYKALEELNNYIISKRNIVNSNTINSLYDMAISNGVKVHDTISKESKKTPYQDLVSEVKKGGKR